MVVLYFLLLEGVKLTRVDGIPGKRGRVALPLRKARAIDDFGSRGLWN